MRTGGRTGGQTDMTKLMAAFRNFAKAPKNGNVLTNFSGSPKTEFHENASNNYRVLPYVYREGY